MLQEEESWTSCCVKWRSFSRRCCKPSLQW